MWEVFRFECRYQLRSPLFWTVAVVFGLLGFLGMASESVSVGTGADNLNLNAAWLIVQSQYVFSILGMFAAVAFVAGAVTRDTESGMAEILFATGVGERAYLFGRFLGSTLFATLAVLAALAGTLTGSFMPWLDPERIGAFQLAPYGFSLVGVMLPNLFIICALFFVVAALTRSMLAAYLAALGFIVTYVVLGAVTDQAHLGYLALGEPFGSVAFDELTKYWSVHERNTRVPGLTGTLLYNRLLWLGIAAVLLAWLGWRYRFSLDIPRLPRLLRRPERLVPAPSADFKPRAPSFGSGLAWCQFRSQVRMDVRGVLRSVPFYVLLVFGLLNVLGNFNFALSELYGTPVHPLTRVLVTAAAGSFALPLLIVIIYYAGELVHRETQSRIGEIVDAAPYPDWMMVAAKVVALWFVITVLLLVVMLTSIVIQLVNGHYQLQIPLYLTGLFFIFGGTFYLWSVAAVFIQLLVRNRFLGMLLFLLLFIFLQAMDSMGLEHGLYQFDVPGAPYSDMNGYGHFLLPAVAFSLYWTWFCGLLLVLGHLLFTRGVDNPWRLRWREARRRFTRPVGAAAALLTLAFFGTGGWIFYNTNVLNDYRTGDALEALQASYEARYKAFETEPLPQVLSVRSEVDLYPATRTLYSRGVAQLYNPGPAPMNWLRFSIAPELRVNALTVEGQLPTEVDEDLGFYQFQLAEPLAGGAARTLNWDLAWENRGFPNSGATTRVVENGTFVNNSEIMPVPGYNSSLELEDNNVRRKHGLPPVRRLPELGDPTWLQRNQFGVRSRSAFQTVMSTAADQIAIAPGYLRREWRQDGRRYFEYQMDEPIWPFFSFSSARYAVARDRWEGVDLEVYYHPAHGYNVQRMLEASRKSLAYFSEAFSPYQYRQFRILEFPRYQRFAQSFPNTIPFSESIGFIADLRDADRIDYVFYVTAHEAAHQWWGHQLVGARMQGMTVLVETLAQYSALMVMEREYGPEHMRRFLKYELDSYLENRGGELIGELPLLRVENQGYIHYRKGSLVMYAIKDRLGETAVNRALRTLLARYAFAGPPFPSSLDLLEALRAEAAPADQELLTDLFERITLFDLRVTDAVARPAADGFEVTLTVEAAKYYADGSGRETEAPLTQILDVGLFPDAGDNPSETDLPVPILLERRPLRSGEQTLTFQVSELPVRAGVDPYVKMIDRNPDDNLRAVVRLEGATSGS